MDGKNENLLPAILAAIVIGAVVGFANGTLVAYVKLPPLVVTMAMASIIQGAINVYTAGKNITGKPLADSASPNGPVDRDLPQYSVRTVFRGRGSHDPAV